MQSDVSGTLQDIQAMIGIETVTIGSLIFFDREKGSGPEAQSSRVEERPQTLTNCCFNGTCSQSRERTQGPSKNHGAKTSMHSPGLLIGTWKGRSIIGAQVLGLVAAWYYREARIPRARRLDGVAEEDVSDQFNAQM